MTDPHPIPSTPADLVRPASLFPLRARWHVVGALLAALCAWLLFQAYRQPSFLIDFVNLRLC